MKVLIFTHKSDIDGMGGAVLAKLAFNGVFDEVEYVLCETFNLQTEVKKYYENESIYNFDRIYVTDLWLEEPMLTKIAKDKKLNNKFFVFDHHKSALEEDFNKYDFTTIRIEDKKGKCCGTSLYYEYLLKEGYLIEKQSIADFVELTRRYDTWEWKTIYNDENARRLTLLFDSVGRDGYINLMVEKLSKESDSNFVFNKLEELLIQNKINQVEEKLLNYSKKMYVKDIMGLKAGIIFVDYEYRNDLSEYLRHQNLDIDFVMLIALDYGTISFRGINGDVNVRLIAEAFGGKGHDKAASAPIKEETKEKIIELLTKL